ncbi:MAG: hypothetical protein ACHQPI_14435 [Thermoanaerobaculia bacterium]
MARKPEDDFESRLDWYYVSRSGVYRALLAFLVLAGIVITGIWWVSNRDANIQARVRGEILRAEERLADVKRLPEADRYADEIARIAGLIDEARKLLGAQEPEHARAQAVAAQQLARNVLSGKSAGRGDASTIEVGGKVEFQRANTTRWETLARGTVLREGDFIKTGASGTAEVMAANGTLYRIRPETLFEVHRSGATIEGESTSGAKIVIGNVETDTGDRGRASLTTDAARAEIARNSAVAIEADARHTGLSTYRGEATLSTSSGRRVVLGERERAEATREKGTISEKQRLPETPVLLEPDDNTAFELGKKDVLLRWSPVKEATFFQVQVARSRLFVPDSIERSKDFPKATTEVRLKANDIGLFFWRVQTIRREPGELASGWSAPRRFKVVPQDMATEKSGVPPDLVVNRSQVIGSTLIVSGKTEPGATVWVAGELADVDATGVFRKVITVSGEGMKVITIRAVNAAGLETIKKESVLIQD